MKTAIVTGAGSGIGQAAATALLRNGYRVTGRSEVGTSGAGGKLPLAAVGKVDRDGRSRGSHAGQPTRGPRGARQRLAAPSTSAEERRAAAAGATCSASDDSAAGIVAVAAGSAPAASSDLPA